MKDKLGTDINVGDTVVWSRRGGGCMSFGKVIDVARFAILIQMENVAQCSTVRTHVISDTSQCVVCAGDLKV